jgi:hypothetical protein
MSIATLRFSAVLFGFAQLMKHAARRHPAFRVRLGERNVRASAAPAGPAITARSSRA